MGENGFFSTIGTALLFSAIYLGVTSAVVAGAMEIPFVVCIPVGFGFVKRLIPTVTKFYSLFRKN